MASRKYKDILVETRGGVGWVTFNRPDRYNTCDFAMFQEIGWGIRELAEDPKIGVIVLTGAGDKAFSAGGYLADLAHFSTNEGRKLFTWQSALADRSSTARRPSVPAKS